MSVPAPVPHLKRSLRRFDIMAIGIAAVISFDVIGQIAAGGGQAATWIGVIVVAFLLPYALIFAETGAAFPQEGGPYVWVEVAFGRLPAALTTMFYWVTNPVWLGGSLVFLAAEAWDGFVFPLGTGTVADYAFKLVFIWIAILTAVISLRRGKWITTAGAGAKVLALAFFTATAVAYGLQHGFRGLETAGFAPTAAGFLALVPVLLFAFVGFEAPNAAGDEMLDPRRDVPVAIAVSASVATCCYLLPVLAILSAAPAGRVTGVGGFMEAARLVFGIYGSWRGPLLSCVAVLFALSLLTQGSAWMIVADRMQAMAAADGGFFTRALGAFHPRLGTPVRMNLLSGVTATLFMAASMNLANGDASAIFGVVLTVAITTLLLSYIAVIPALLALRLRHRAVPRPYQVPFGTRGFTVAAVLVYAWILLGCWVALFPGTLERLVGFRYDFRATWGVSRPTFEAFTLGTVAVLLAIAAAGYLVQRWRAPSADSRTP
ncbi:putative amino acid permease [Streptomyces nigrescens]|uniref:Amino acid permease n=2 Tax=Streptomyces TaxID=1883 RepID=A0ABN6QWE1_STRNI|nr:APC family permease [Streptomyces nigrescens]MEE4419660.1 APC family permease [Streptomyces sp. DSM 41528]BDM70509.1 putative amino acid permease [Streptomyces nigrescens]